MPTSVRLAELLASLSLAIDLGTGQPMEWVMKSTLMGIHFAEALGLNETERREVYYLSLLRHIGCTATASYEAELFDDELKLGEGLVTDSKSLPQAFSFLLRNTARGKPLAERVHFLGKALAAGPASKNAIDNMQCEVAVSLAATLDISQEIRRALNQIFERWDGQGVPNHLRHDAIALPVRVVQIAQDAVTFQMIAGVEAAVNGVRSRAGTILDPTLADVFCKSAYSLFSTLDLPSLWEAVVIAEPGPPILLANEPFERALFTIADFADMKSPYFVSHSREVSELSAQAAKLMGLSDIDVQMTRQAGLIHDLGCVGISSSIWNKGGALTESEWERVRLHSNFTERIFARSTALAPLGDFAALHHERLDGSGYHRRLPATLLPVGARLLATTDVYCALRELRPQRPAYSSDQAADELRLEVKNGKLDSETVNAVLGAAGHKVDRSYKSKTSHLTSRELEVLRLMARSYSTKAIAHELAITNKTADHHIQNIYGKIGVSTRAGATLYAMQNYLL